MVTPLVLGEGEVEQYNAIVTPVPRLPRLNILFESFDCQPCRTRYVDDAWEFLTSVGQELLVAERDHHLET